MNSDSGLLTRSGAHQVARPRLTDRPAWLSWSRIALPALLLLTAAAYTWDLTSSGNANSFYAAAVQAGTRSWKALFFGSLDSSSFITVDKPPASLWVMALSGRVFGFSSASMLLPQVLEGLAAVGLLYAAVRRWFGTGAGLAAGALLALTPVAALMFRFNNPDALLVALLVAAAYCLTRALETASTRWILAVGTMVGFAFLAKMMQAFLVLPGFALVYLVAAPTGFRRRILQLLAGGVAIVVSAGWWVAIVALWPAGSRPMIDGSSDNSILNLITGYNGLGRIFGASGPGGGGGGANFSGSTGVLRLFNTEMGAQASWLLPAALLALVAGIWCSRRAPRIDRARAALIMWGGWLLVSGVVFSLGSGVIHTYYTVALAPAIAALVAIGGQMLWTRRSSSAARALAIVALLGTAGWSWVLLDRTPGWEPGLRTVVAGMALAAVSGLAVTWSRSSWARRLALPAVILGVAACLAGPVAFAAQTVTTPHTGSVPSAGPQSSTMMGGGAPGGARAGAPGGASGGAPGGASGGAPGGASGGAPGGAGGGAPASARGGAPGSPPAGATAARGAGFPGRPGTGARGGFTGSASFGGGRSLGGGGGGQATVSSALKRALTANAAHYRWVAATSGSESAASLELSTGGDPVMAIGGFNNQGGNLTLARFKQYVAAGQIHYYIASGAGGGPNAASGSTSDIPTWVAAHFKKVTIGGQALYDLTQRA